MGMRWQELRYCGRLLAKSPGFTAVALLTLALGIGANTAIFSVINGLLLHPAGVPQPGQLVALRVKYDKLNLNSIPVSAPDFADVRDATQVFSSAAMLVEADFNYVASDLPERLLGAQVSWRWFDVFGARPLLGRVFRPEEDQPNANHVAVLSYRTWRGVFGGDAGVVGRTIQLNQQPCKVVGVMGPEFNWPGEAQLWVPLGLAADSFSPQNRFNEGLFAVARIWPEITLERAQAYVALLTRRLIEHDPGAGFAKDSAWGMFILPLTAFVFGDLKGPMLVLLGAVGFVLLIACSNIAGLMLARSTSRAREFAVRAALGATRWDLIRQSLVESGLLAGAGTLLGLLFAAAGIRILLRLAPEALAQGLVIRADAYVLFFAALLGVLAGVLSGVAPAWQVSSMRQFEVLKEGGRSGTASRGKQRLRSLLVAGEVALALVLLVGTGLFLKSLARLERINPGFEPRGVMTAALTLPESQYKEPEKRIAFYQAVVERLASVSDVSLAAAVAPLPFSGSNASASFNIEGRVLGPADPGPHSDLRWVTPEYFKTMGIPLLRGRSFTDQDRTGSQPVVAIDENLARQYWPDQDPVGQRLRRGTRAPWATIVGVVGHVYQSALIGDTGKGVCYYPMYQQPVPRAFLVANSKGDAAALGGAIRAAIRAVDPVQPVYDLTTMERRVGSSLAPRRFAVTLLGFFAGVALLMAALGLYGVISYSVTQRTQEIGIRMALGAQSRQVLALVLGQGMKLAGAGALMGLLVAWVLARVLSSQLPNVGALDPAVLAATVTILLVVALLASWIPAWRATKVDPMVALRYE